MKTQYCRFESQSSCGSLKAPEMKGRRGSKSCRLSKEVSLLGLTGLEMQVVDKAVTENK